MNGMQRWNHCGNDNGSFLQTVQSRLGLRETICGIGAEP
jgi:hypothetical protein